MSVAGVLYPIHTKLQAMREPVSTSSERKGVERIYYQIIDKLPRCHSVPHRERRQIDFGIEQQNMNVELLLHANGCDMKMSDGWRLMMDGGAEKTIVNDRTDNT